MMLLSLKAEDLNFSDHLIFSEFCADFPPFFFSAFVMKLHSIGFHSAQSIG